MGKTLLLFAVLVVVVTAQTTPPTTAVAVTTVLNPAGSTNDTIVGEGDRPVKPEADVPTVLECPTTADASSVFLTANATHPSSLYSSQIAWNEIVATTKVPAPPQGCVNPPIATLPEQINISSICAVTVPDGFIVISNFNVTLPCNYTTYVEANIRINGTADDDIEIRNFTVGAWAAVSGAPPPVEALPSPPVEPSPSPRPPTPCRGNNKPVCQFLIMSMNTCCNNTGIVTALPFMDLQLACSADYISYPDYPCLIVDGPPANMTQWMQPDGGVGYRLVYGNDTMQYNGTITIAVNQTAECALTIGDGGCQIDGEVYTSVPQVENFTVTVQNPNSTQYFNWIDNAANLNRLASTSWLVTGKNESGKGCRTTSAWNLPPFFYYNFANYTSNSTFGTQLECNSGNGATCTALNATQPVTSSSTPSP